MDSSILFLLFLCFLVLLGLAIIVLLIIWPVQVAKKRGLEENQITAVTLVSVLGTIFFGLGWAVAAVMAYLLPVKEFKEEQSDLEKLAKLGQLYKQGIITEEEFEREKLKLMK